MPDPIDLLEGPVFAPGPPPAFVEAVSHCLDLLRRRFPRYDDFLRHHGVAAAPLTTLEQVEALPPLFLPVLKGMQFPLPAGLEVVAELTSSGTTGRPSVVPQDEPSWRRRVHALLAAYRGVGALGGTVEVLAFLLDPATTRMAGSLVIDAALKSQPGVRSVRYLARQGPTGPDFSLPAAAQALAEAARRGPVVLVGYPALIGATVLGLARSGTPCLPLPEGSQVLTGGGWKSFLPDVPVEQGPFRAQVSAFFAIPPGAVRDMFGLSECPAVFVQCAEGRYHVPAFAWAQAIEPESGREVPPGETGLLQLTVPLTTSYPLLKILTTDKVSLTCGCPCGLEAPTLTPRGRASAARYETCAVQVGRAVA